MSVERITKKQALRAARAKLPILGDKKLQQHLEWAADSLAEAYRIGAEEAQGVICGRINAIKPAGAERAADLTSGAV